jgi:hypothetical protein
MDDEHTQSVIWFQDKKTKIQRYIRIPLITRLAKEQVVFYNAQKIPMILYIETLGPDWRREGRFQVEADFAVSSYQDCLEIKPAQRENMGYEKYLEYYKDDGHFDEMIMSMAADSYYKARRKNNTPPYALGSAVNLGFAIHSLGKHLKKDIFHQFIRMVGWEPNKENVPAIITLWQGLCRQEQIYINARIAKDQTQPYLFIHRSKCIWYIATLLGMSKQDLEELFIV